MQKRRNSSALAMELRLSCIKPSIWCVKCFQAGAVENAKHVQNLNINIRGKVTIHCDRIIKALMTGCENWINE